MKKRREEEKKKKKKKKKKSRYGYVRNFGMNLYMKLFVWNFGRIVYEILYGIC